MVHWTVRPSEVVAGVRDEDIEVAAALDRRIEPGRCPVTEVPSVVESP
jgi:hypothetical protein